MTDQLSEPDIRVRLRQLYSQYALDKDFAPGRVQNAMEPRRLVSGHGPTNPRLLFVTKCPSTLDQRLGYLLSGACGVVYDDLLGSVGLGRDTVYTTALVKYRRGDNAEPNETEMLSSLKYLSQEHRLLGRPPIVLFGRKVQEAFLHLNKYKLVIPARKEMKTGQWVWFQSGIGFPLLALHDPTFAVYQRGNLPSMVRDFQAVLNPPSAQPA